REAISSADAAAVAPTGDEPSELLGRLAGIPPVERDRVLLDLVRSQVAAVLGYSTVKEVGAQRPFKELGFDSLTGVELRNRLNMATGLRLPASLVFDYPTPTALAHYLREEIMFALAAIPAASEELDRLDAALVAVPADDAEARSRITHRLQAMLARLGSDEPATRADLGSVSDGELFDLLDGELGTP
ncbi:MAG: phosphopantetheine-binding protein, partial [Actinomycetota bacterium]|nr:phosphopantetheine-binding protein [Actinomycetota bacterium]